MLRARHALQWTGHPQRLRRAVPQARLPLCIGCYGPAEGVLDYGARLISALLR
jgi:hypothetical protein